MSVLDGDETVYIARNGTNRSMNTGFVLGARVPAQVTAAGRLMLALRDPQEVEVGCGAKRSRPTHLTPSPARSACRSNLHASAPMAGQYRSSKWS